MLGFVYVNVYVKGLSKDVVLQIMAHNIVESCSSGEIFVGKNGKIKSNFLFIHEAGYISNAFLVTVFEEH